MPTIPCEPAEATEPHESEYGPDGLYRHGPQRAIPITTRLARLTMSRYSDPRPSPALARASQLAKQQQARAEVARRSQPKPKKSKAHRVLASVQGWAPGRTSARAA